MCYIWRELILFILVHTDLMMLNESTNSVSIIYSFKNLSTFNFNYLNVMISNIFALALGC